MKMIPVSEIDSLIKAAEDSDKTSLDTFTKRWTDFEVGSMTRAAVLSHLRGLEEKAIPAVAVNEVIEVLDKAQNTAEWDIIDDFKWRLKRDD